MPSMRTAIHLVLGMSLLSLGACAEQPGKKKEEATKTETKTEAKPDGTKTETKTETKVEVKTETPATPPPAT